MQSRLVNCPELTEMHKRADTCQCCKWQGCYGAGDSPCAAILAYSNAAWLALHHDCKAPYLPLQGSVPHILAYAMRVLQLLQSLAALCALLDPGVWRGRC